MATLEQIQQKCDQVGLQTKLTTRKIEDSDNVVIAERTELFIQIPFERDFKSIILDQKSEYVNIALASDFEKFRFLKGYDAIYSAELGIIECGLQSEDKHRLFLNRRLARFLNNAQKETIQENAVGSEEREERFAFPSPSQDMKITIGSSTDEFSILSSNKKGSLFFRRTLKRFPTIKIDGLKFTSHSEAKDILLEIGNSVCFQIDLISDFPVHLAYDIDFEREIRIRRRATKDSIEFTAPKYKYDVEAISLYWYGRTANNMPLLQFLAYYQVLEYHFPLYSSREAQQKIKNILKDPRFDGNNDKAISKILDVIKLHGGNKSFGDERSQINATFKACIDETELIEFLSADEERKDFFDSHKKSKTLVAQKINFNKKDGNVLSDVANRIYDLRCRIVHTKDDYDIELLLPYSPDLAYIKHDIDLIEYLARKVLIANGKPLSQKTQ